MGLRTSIDNNVVIRSASCLIKLSTLAHSSPPSVFIVHPHVVSLWSWSFIRHHWSMFTSCPPACGTSYLPHSIAITLSITQIFLHFLQSFYCSLWSLFILWQSLYRDTSSHLLTCDSRFRIHLFGLINVQRITGMTVHTMQRPRNLLLT